MLYKWHASVSSTFLPGKGKRIVSLRWTWAIVSLESGKLLLTKMEIQKVIEYLNHQRSMIDETITCLERLSEGSVVPVIAEPAKRRGRKFMDAEDRLKVSQRMKEYWASRRMMRTHHAGGSA